MNENEFKESAIEFMEAVCKAEEAGTHEFVCPLCGGKARFYRSDYNGHLMAGCEKCRMRVLE